MGLHNAGLDVIGIDINPDLNYPFPRITADAMPILKRMARDGVNVLREYGLDPDGIELIWASPPCQSFSAYRRKDPNRVGAKAKDLIAKVRRYLDRIGLPYIIENVEAAPLKNAIRLCGSSFGLDVRRHRLFECSFPVKPLACDHALHVSRGKQFPGATNRPAGRYTCEVGVYRIPLEIQRKVMGIDWMTLAELSQAIPPAYSEYLAKEFLGLNKNPTRRQRAAVNPHRKNQQMGMKPRTKPALKLNKETRECIKDYSTGICELLKSYKIPKKDWLRALDCLEDWPKADADQDLHWFIGWINGAAVALGCNLEDLVVL
jgi:DNA (cytosine-5)-methyltransferase 1